MIVKSSMVVVLVFAVFATAAAAAALSCVCRDGADEG